MQISVIDDQTIECILSAEDVKNKGIVLDELCYSSPVMRSLFSELLHYLKKKYDFGSEASPAAAIDAIPMSDGSLVILFSQGDYMDDADPRYSDFSDADTEESSDDTSSDREADSEDSFSVGDILKSIFNAFDSRKAGNQYLLRHDSTDEDDSWCESVFEFDSMTDISRAFSQLLPVLKVTAAIYHSANGSYIVPVRFIDMDDDSIRMVSDILCEFSYPREISIGTELYISEHCEMISDFSPLIAFHLVFKKLA